MGYAPRAIEHARDSYRETVRGYNNILGLRRRQNGFVENRKIARAARGANLGSNRTGCLNRLLMTCDFFISLARSGAVGALRLTSTASWWSSLRPSPRRGAEARKVCQVGPTELMQVGPRIAGARQRQRAEVGPASGPAWRLSHLGEGGDGLVLLGEHHAQLLWSRPPPG
jgi:hypothetical protein